MRSSSPAAQPRQIQRNHHHKKKLAIGAAMPNWQPCPSPERIILEGNWCRIEPLNLSAHAESLFATYSEDHHGEIWTYLSVGPFTSQKAFNNYVEKISKETDPLHYAVINKASGLAVGTLALMRHQPEHGVVEVGFVVFSPAMQRSRLATEAQFLLMTYVFEKLNYRRYEWKCDSLNERSRNAALRLGFVHEGTFRQAIVYKNRNRDTAWFSIIDKDWPTVKAALQQWLHPANFDADGRQIRRLQLVRAQQNPLD